MWGQGLETCSQPLLVAVRSDLVKFQAIAEAAPDVHVIALEISCYLILHAFERLVKIKPNGNSHVFMRPKDAVKALSLVFSQKSVS
jgi:hypothetical protein